MGASVTLVEGADRVLAREPSPSARSWAKRSGPRASSSASASTLGRLRDGDEYVLEFPERSALRADRLLVATGGAGTQGLGLEAAGVEMSRQGITVDGHMNAVDGSGRSAT